jgi:hypothetical protein
MEITLKKISLILGIIISSALILGYGCNAYGGLAKKDDVRKVDDSLARVDELLAERIEIGGTDQQIYQAEQQIQRYRDIEIIRDRPLTDMEQEELEKKKERKEVLEKKREKQEEYYKELKRAK